ncbi:TRAP transporter small permease [Roseovarius spongiae]|uniref:TRAP transporter small permease protein n=2 Tax=Roseovarius spongiae TaxID=2320272 RepID=A0A3A8ASB2_9RHOB|nr:TRAP transporter small permease [Roseovarius spongiae]
MRAPPDGARMFFAEGDDMIARAFIHINNMASAAAMWISAGLLVYMTCHITLEIILRSFFSTSTFSMDEFVGYAVGAMTFLALADTFRHRKHIRVSILTGYLQGTRAALAVELICIALTFGVTLFLARFIWRTLARDFSRGSVSPTLMEVPLWWMDAVIFVGLALFMVQLVASAIQAITEGVPEDVESDA